MAFVSITRLRLRSPLYLLPFFYHTIGSTRELLRHPGFLRGSILPDRHLTFWTMTLWDSDAAMRSYRNAGAHKKAMPKLQHWCDEASVVHWEQEEEALPNWLLAHERMKTEGRLSKVKHSSPNQALPNIPPPRYPSRTERILSPKRNE